MGVNKIVWLIEDSMTRRRSTALKVVKRRAILNYWKEYKSVAHFWCALRLLKYKFGVRGYPDCTPLRNKAGITTTLTLLLGSLTNNLSR